MSHILSRVPVLRQFVDERFLDHRRRASSFAGIAIAILSLLVFEYRLLRYHVWSWDLALVAVVFIVIKMSLFVWYRLSD